MSLRFAILTRLDIATLADFQALLRKPATTIDGAHLWLVDRGVKISRGAVGNYVKHFRDQYVSPLAVAGSSASDDELRARLAQLSTALCGCELKALVSSAERLIEAPNRPGEQRQG